MCVAIVIGTLFSTSLLIQSVDHSLDVGLSRLGADLLVVPEGTVVTTQESLLMGVPVNFYMSKDMEDKIADVFGVEKVSSQLFIVSLEGAPCCVTGEYQLIAFDSKTDFTITPWLESQLNGPLVLDKDEIIVGADTTFPVGMSLYFYGHFFTIKHKLAKSGLGMDRAGFMTMEDAYAMIEESRTSAEEPIKIPPNSISAVLVKIREPRAVEGRVGLGTSADDIALNIEKSVKGVDVIRTGEMTSTVKDDIKGLTATMYLLSTLMLIMALLLIGGVYSMAVNERRREIGIMRAIGAKRLFIFKQVISEAVLLAVFGGAAGMIGGAFLIYYFNLLIRNFLGIPFLWPSIAGLILLATTYIGLSAAIGVVASFYPAFRSTKLEPYDAIRGGEL